MNDTERAILVTRLCNYDTRNPLSKDLLDPEFPIKAAEPGCMCDNCFYGRHKLAETILSLDKDLQDYFNAERLKASAESTLTRLRRYTGRFTPGMTADRNRANDQEMEAIRVMEEIKQRHRTRS